MDEGERIYDPERIFHSAVTLTLDLETWFKVTAHPLFKGTQWVKYEPNWAKERENMLVISDLEWTDELTDRWMDGWTNRLINTGHLLSGALIRYTLQFDYCFK